MKIYEIAVLIACVLIVAAVIIKWASDRRKGKCNGCCEGCKNCNKCDIKEDKEKEEKQ